LAAIEKALALTAAVAAAPATACACSAEDVGGLLVVSAAVWLGGLWGWLLGNCVPVWYLRGLLSWVVQERTCACLLVKHPEERRGSPLPLLHVQLVKLHHYSYFASLQLVNLHQIASCTTCQYSASFQLILMPDPTFLLYDTQKEAAAAAPPAAAANHCKTV